MKSNSRFPAEVLVQVGAIRARGLASILLLIDTARTVSVNLPSVAGQLGAGYAIPMLYAPALFWMHTPRVRATAAARARAAAIGRRAGVGRRD